jgi:hypothetical protein
MLKFMKDFGTSNPGCKEAFEKMQEETRQSRLGSVARKGGTRRKRLFKIAKALSDESVWYVLEISLRPSYIMKTDFFFFRQDSFLLGNML